MLFSKLILMAFMLFLITAISGIAIANTIETDSNDPGFVDVMLKNASNASSSSTYKADPEKALEEWATASWIGSNGGPAIASLSNIGADSGVSPSSSDGGSSDPGNGTTDPGNGTTDPGNGTTDPGNGSSDPGNGTTDPGSGLGN
jgi:hypothetical protein